MGNVYLVQNTTAARTFIQALYIIRVMLIRREDSQRSQILERQIKIAKKSAKNSLENYTKFGYKCTCLNAMSIVNKINELNIMVENTDTRVIGITESWATTDTSDAELGVTGYVMFRKDRIEKGEVKLFYILKNPPRFMRKKIEKEAECEEAVWSNLVIGNTTLSVGLVCRSPNTSIDENGKVQNAIKEV